MRWKRPMHRSADDVPFVQSRPGEEICAGLQTVCEDAPGDAPPTLVTQLVSDDRGLRTAHAKALIPPSPTSDGKSRRRCRLYVVAGLVVVLGGVLAAFAAHQLLWTNVQAARAQDATTQDLRDQWRRSPVDRAAPTPGSGDSTPSPIGAGVALLHIPRLGAEYVMPVIEGTRESDLARGAGHYPGTALPGQVGNFAVAGHRSTYGQPFRNLDRLQTGDAIVVETSTTWFTYEVNATRIVRPSQSEVLLPVPGQPNAQPTQQLLTLTTCHPRYSAKQRLIVHAHLMAQQDKTEGAPPSLIS